MISPFSENIEHATIAWSDLRYTNVYIIVVVDVVVVVIIIIIMIVVVVIISIIIIVVVVVVVIVVNITMHSTCMCDTVYMSRVCKPLLVGSSAKMLAMQISDVITTPRSHYM